MAITVPDVAVTGDPGHVADHNTMRTALLALESADISTPFYNVLQHGAFGNGTTDDTAAINAAINAVGPGGVVYLPHTGASYRINSPIIMKDSVELRGDMAPRFLHYSGTTTGTVIKPLATFTGTAWLTITGDASASAFLMTALRIRYLSFDGSALTTGSAHGIYSTGFIYDLRLEDVTVLACRGDGIHLHDDGTGAKALATTMEHVAVRGSLGHNFSMYQADGYYADCFSLSAGLSGFSFTRYANTTMIGCRSEHSGNDGYLIAGEIGGGSTMSGCITDRSNFNGVHITGTAGQGSIVIDGMACRRDGRNGGTGGGNYAAIRVEGCTQPVVVSGFTVAPGVADDGSETNSPQIGVSVSTSRVVSLANGHIHAATTAINDAGDNTVILLRHNITQATGTLGAPTYSYANTEVYSPGTFIGVGKVPAAPVDLTYSSANIGMRAVYTGSTGMTNPLFHAEGVEGVGRAFQAQVTGDSVARSVVLNSGQWSIGSGSATRDVTVERGAANQLKITATAGVTLNTVLVLTGTGTPEAVVTAVVGSLYLRLDGGTSTTLYVKTSGVGNTGWTAK